MSCDVKQPSLQIVGFTPKGNLDVLSPSKLSDMKAYAAQLRKKHPTMKPQRLQRKVAEYFKIKLV